MCDLYTLTTSTGEVHRITSADIDVPHAGHLYSASGPSIGRGQVRVIRGLEVDTLALSIQSPADYLLSGMPFVPSALSGALDGARVLLHRAFMSGWGAAPAGVVLLFSGRVSDLSGSRHSLSVNVKSDLELLNTKLPRNVYQAGCMHTVYDQGCGAVKQLVSGTVTGHGGTGHWLNSNIGHPGSWFANGVLTLTSGAMSGTQRTIKSHASGRFDFALPLPQAPGIGDTFSVYRGCDKTQTTCAIHFNNLPRFRGFPFIPVPESVT